MPIMAASQIVADGVATPQACNCYEITPNSPNQVGGFHETATIDLTNPFDYIFTVNFGCDNTGGEGVAFVLQSGAWTLGSNGAGIGYQGIANSLAIEFDTRDNQAAGENMFGDNSADHVAIQANGSIDHLSANNLLGFGTLYNINPASSEVENCQDHLIEIIWDPATTSFDVIVNGSSSFGGPQNVGNIVANQFGGNPIVTWGWTGSTGVLPASPNQTVCLALEPQMTYSATNCPNQPINFSATADSYYPIAGYSWDFDGLGTSNLQNPTFTFTTAGNHPVVLSVTDINGCVKSDTFDLGIGFDLMATANDTIICPNDTTTLHAIALPFVNNSCCYELRLKDLWLSGWYGNYVEVFENGVSVGTYTMGPQSTQNVVEVHQICFAQNSTVDVVVHGPMNGGTNDPTQFPNECEYEIVDQNGVQVAYVPAGGATFYDGATQTFLVDCGIIPPTYNYLWDNAGLLDNNTIANPVATVSSTTTFTVQVTDPATGCTIPDSVTIYTSPPASATISGNITVCQGNTDALTINFIGTPPFDVTVNEPGGGTQVFTGITTNPFQFQAGLAGTYTLQTMSGDGCIGTVSGSATVNVIIPPGVDVEANQTLCDGDPINPLNVVSNNGGIVNWYSDAGLTNLVATGNTFMPPAVVGTSIYYAQETETVLGCAGPVDNVVIVVNPIPSAPIVNGNLNYCDGDMPSALVAEMSLNGTATWYNNSALTPPSVSNLLTFTPTLTVGTQCYYVVETANGCTGPSTQVCVVTNPTPNPPSVLGDTTYCEGETPTALTASPSSGGNINWYVNNQNVNTNSSTYTPDITIGTHLILVTETLNGCESEPTTINIIVNQMPVVTVPNSVSICKYDSIQVTAQNNGYDILWDNGDTTSTSWLYDTITRDFIVVSSNPLCGSSSDTVTLIVNNNPIIVTSNDTIIGIGGEVDIWAIANGSGNVIYNWSPQPEECITENCSKIYVVPETATTYVVTVTDANGCSSQGSIFVDISGYMEVFIPNVFSPNGDGIHDVFEIKGPRLFNFTLLIYDRWGKLVYETNDQKDYWDGTFKGKFLAEQTFVYVLKGETVLGEIIDLSGNVTIIK
jgi:gliding motility-associated-like protein